MIKQLTFHKKSDCIHLSDDEGLNNIDSISGVETLYNMHTRIGKQLLPWI